MVKIKIERPGEPKWKTVVPTELKRQVLEEFTSSSSGAFMKTPGIIFRTPLQRRELFGGVTFEKGVPKGLFESPIQKYAKIVPVPNLMNERFQVLAEASEILTSNEVRNFGYANHKRIQILELPSVWGAWSKGFNEGRGRYVAIIQYYNAGRLNYAFEIEHNEGTESYAIGIINKTNNDIFDIHDFTCVLKHCQRRIYLRGKKRNPSDAYCGIWPTSSEYYDIIGMKLVHSPKRTHPHFLANDLLSKGIKSISK